MSRCRVGRLEHWPSHQTFGSFAIDLVGQVARGYCASSVSVAFCLVHVERRHPLETGRKLALSKPNFQIAAILCESIRSKWTHSNADNDQEGALAQCKAPFGSIWWRAFAKTDTRPALCENCCATRFLRLTQKVGALAQRSQAASDFGRRHSQQTIMTSTQQRAWPDFRLSSRLRVSRDGHQD